MSDIDQDLYDRVMAEMPEWFNPYGHTPPEIQPYDRAARTAARISAERQQPVSDEELLDTFNLAWNEAVSRQRVEGFRVVGGNPGLAGVRAVRAALGPAVPVIPEGWRLDHIIFDEIEPKGYQAGLTKDDPYQHVQGYHPSEPFDALNDAIEAAKESDSE